jgi:hypothetical protein
MDNYRNCSANEQKHQLDNWNNWIKSEVVDHLEEESSFHFPKLHIMTHFRRCIMRFCGLQQRSTEVGQVAHKTQIQDGNQASNKIGHVYRRIVNYYLRRDTFAVRCMNLNANGFSNVTCRPPELGWAICPLPLAEAVRRVPKSSDRCCLARDRRE